MLDQLIIGDKASFDDFGASIAERTINPPPKKEIKETVPFSNVTYDFSAINGELYWGERELEYIFEITAPNPEELENKKTAFANWVMNVMEEKIFDPFIPDFHFLGTYADMTPDDEDNVVKTTITVKFKARPYKIANKPKVYTFTIPANTETAKTVINNSGHKITPIIITDVGIILTLDSGSYSVPIGETTDSSLKLNVGENTLIIQSKTDCIVTVKFYEEVF